MPLWTLNQGTTVQENNQGATATDVGQTVTASGTPHAVGTWLELIASSAFDAYGITITLSGLATVATTNDRCLVNIGVGANGSETIMIPSLMCGNVGQWSSASSKGPVQYYFPLFIPAATRIAANCQALIASETVGVSVYLHQKPLRPRWFGTRVTAYGANTGASTGVSHSPGNGSYAAATEITASTANPISFMQIGIDLFTATAGATASGLVRIGIGSTPTYIIDDLPFSESTTLEQISCAPANMILAQQAFDLDSGTRLVVSAMRNVAAATRGFIIYGCD